MSESKRYLGLDLAGARNQKTVLAILEYYPKEQKTFLLDTYEHIGESDTKTGDEVLLSIIFELKSEAAKMAVNVPLDLPPCITCRLGSCPLPSKCRVSEVKWMQSLIHKLHLKQATPYTQRPVELWIKNKVLPRLPKNQKLEIDEALGGNKAPLSENIEGINP